MGLGVCSCHRRWLPMGEHRGNRRCPVEELSSTRAQKKGEVARGMWGCRRISLSQEVLKPGCSTIKVHTYPLESLLKFQIPGMHP